eukprot:gene7599-9100_t
MTELSALTCDSIDVISFLDKGDDEAVTLNVGTSSEAKIMNKLVEMLSLEFLDSGRVLLSEVSEKIEIIRTAFEDASGSDEELIEAINEIETARSYEDVAARCLAFAGDIHYAMWTDVCAQSSHRLHLVLLASKKATVRIAQLVACMPEKPLANSYGYLGYDERDVQDFDNEGYDQSEKAGHDEAKSAIQDNINVWFLVLYQIFAQPVPQLSKKVVASRARKNSRHSSRRLVKIKDSTSSDTAASTDPFDSFDLVAFITEVVHALLELLGRHQLAEEAHNNCVKVVACINAQMPRLQHVDSNEVAAGFAAADSGDSGENLTQGLLYLLNENGYPHIHNSETLAGIRLCKDLLNVEKETPEDGDEESEGHTVTNFARGHFYTNDVKVMVDIIIRELSNIPHNTSGLVTLVDVDSDEAALNGTVSTSGRSKRSSSRAEKIAHVLHGTVRFAYLELLDAIVNKSTWTSSGDCYMKDQLKTLLDEVLAREDERCKKFVQDFLSKYDYYIN